MPAVVRFPLSNLGALSVDVIEYRGWKNNLRIANADCELVVTLDVGPRVISYRLTGGANVMKNYESMMGGTGEAEWQIRGGHRFWLAPEDLTRTYFADNRPVKWEVLGTTGGGVEIIPLPPKKDHPGHVSNAKSPADYGPNQELVLWPYFDFADTRWTFGKRYALLRQDVNKGPTKIGLSHREGWVAYLNGGTLFVKRFDYREGAVYPDRGTRYQTFSNEDMLEMETVGELVTLQPGASAELVESWELHGGVPPVQNEAAVDRVILPLIGKAQ